MDWEREELAREALEEADLSPAIHPYLLAHRLGFRVRDGGPGCEGVCLDATKEILIDESERAERRGFGVCHETGHHLQRRHGLRDTEAGANYLASALLLPRLEFEIDLKRHGWDLLALKSRHRHASFEALARRIHALREARVTVFDEPLRGQGRRGWYSVPRGGRPTRNERAAANEAADGGAPVEVVAGVTGWPVIEHDWIRVIVVTAL